MGLKAACAQRNEFVGDVEILILSILNHMNLWPQHVLLYRPCILGLVNLGPELSEMI